MPLAAIPAPLAAGGACAEVREIAAMHLAEVRAKLADLKAMERVLVDAVHRCDAGGTLGCPLIGVLASGPARSTMVGGQQ